MSSVLLILLGFFLPVLGVIRPIIFVMLILVMPFSVNLLPVVTVFGVNQSFFGAFSLISLPILSIGCIIYLRSFVKFIWPIFASFTTMTLLIIINTYLSGYPLIEGMRSGAGLFYLVLVISFSFICVKTNISFKVVLTLSIMISVYICLDALADFFIFRVYTRIDGYRAARSASFYIQNPTDFAVYSLLYFSICLAMCFSRKSFWWLALSLFYFVSILTTYSLASIGGAIIVIIVLLSLTGVHKRLLMWAVGAYLVVLVTVVVIGSNIYSLPIFDRARGLGTGPARLGLWDYCFHLIQRRPFFGYTYPVSQELLSRIFGYDMSPHNAFVSWLLNYGIIGTMLTVFAFVWVGVKLYHISNADNTITAFASRGCLAYLTALTFFGLTHSFGPAFFLLYPFWVLTFCLLGLSARRSNNFAQRI